MLIRILATARVTISVGYSQIIIFQEIKALRAEKILRPVVTFDAFGDDNNETPEKETDNKEVAKGLDFGTYGQEGFQVEWNKKKGKKQARKSLGEVADNSRHYTAVPS